MAGLSISADDLTKKVGPLKLWQWIAIGGGGILAYYLYERYKSGSSSSSSSSSVDPATGLTYAQEAQEEAEGINPYTGQPLSDTSTPTTPSYGSGSGGGGWTGGGGSSGTAASTPTTPSLATEIGDVTSLAQALQGLETTLNPNPAAPASNTGTTAQQLTSTAMAKLPVAAQIAAVNAGLAPASALGPQASKVYAAGDQTVAQYQKATGTTPKTKGAAASAKSNHKPKTTLTSSQILSAIRKDVAAAVTKAQPKTTPVKRTTPKVDKTTGGTKAPTHKTTAKKK